MATIQCETCQYNFRQVKLAFSTEIRIHSEEDHNGEEFEVLVLN